MRGYKFRIVWAVYYNNVFSHNGAREAIVRAESFADAREQIVLRPEQVTLSGVTPVRITEERIERAMDLGVGERIVRYDYEPERARVIDEKLYRAGETG